MNFCAMKNQICKLQYKQILDENEICRRWSSLFKLLNVLEMYDYANKIEENLYDQNLGTICELLEDLS